MKVESIFICAFSVFSIFGFAQQKQDEKKQDSVNGNIHPTLLLEWMLST
jgi:hypothetical protein